VHQRAGSPEPVQYIRLAWPGAPSSPGALRLAPVFAGAGAALVPGHGFRFGKRWPSCCRQPLKVRGTLSIFGGLVRHSHEGRPADSAWREEMRATVAGKVEVKVIRTPETKAIRSRTRAKSDGR